MRDTPRVDAVTGVERFYADQELIVLARALERELGNARKRMEKVHNILCAMCGADHEEEGLLDEARKLLNPSHNQVRDSKEA